jgi:hypothetical protein
VIAATANRLIVRNGRVVTFRQFNQTPNDSNKPWRGPTNPRAGATEVTVSAAFLSPTRADLLGVSRKDDELVKRTVQIALVAPGPDVTADLSVFHEIVDESSTWQIIWVELLRPAETRILYFVGVGR